MRLSKTHPEPATSNTLPDTYDPEHPESGATTAEYGMLAGGVVLTGGLLYEILTSDWFNTAMRGVFEMLFKLLMDTIKNAVSAGAIMPPSLF